MGRPPNEEGAYNARLNLRLREGDLELLRSRLAADRERAGKRWSRHRRLASLSAWIRAKLGLVP